LAAQVVSRESLALDGAKTARPKSAPNAEDLSTSDASPAATWLQAQDMAGASAESERAVETALAWLAEHQLAAGGWSFDHRLGLCQGRCSSPGTAMAKAVHGATGMALLPFVGHGSTHLSGPYQKNVAAGLRFLMARMRKDGSLWEQGGQMYSHALALTAFCEDLRVCEEVFRESESQAAMQAPAPPLKRGPRPATSRGNRDLKSKADAHGLRKPGEPQQQGLSNRIVSIAALKALSFAFASQDSHGGGWRYEPRSSDSDISVTGWYVMAFHSATAIDVPIPLRTTAGVNTLLDSLQSDYGAAYGYRVSMPAPTPTRTSIGLLCRAYTGWDRRQLQRGVEKVAATGPSENDMYYNYYATLLLHHYGGPLWDDWNRKLRDYLIQTQSRTGHETGSWSFRPCESNAAGGRHFDTCMACLILETYYRSKPVYSLPGQAEDKMANRPIGGAREAPARVDTSAASPKKRKVVDLSD